MSLTQKKAASLVAMLLVSIPCLYLMALFLASLGADPIGDSAIGEFGLAVAADRGAAMGALKLLPVVVTVGLSFIIPKNKGDWRFLVTIGMSLVGLILAVYLYFDFASADQAHRLWSYTEVNGMDTPTAVDDHFRPTLLAIAGWFLAILATQLGVNLINGGGDAEG